MSGVVRIEGNASESAAASAHGGHVFIAGDASLRAGISLKGGTLVVAGDIGNAGAFMAQPAPSSWVAARGRRSATRCTKR